MLANNKPLLVVAVVVLVIGVALFVMTGEEARAPSEVEAPTETDTSEEDTETTDEESTEPADDGVPTQSSGSAPASSQSSGGGTTQQTAPAPQPTPAPAPSPEPDNFILLNETDQGNFVTVAVATLDLPGYAVIYRVNSNGDTQYVGNSGLLTVGTHRNIKIQLDRIVAEGQAVVGVLYRDNGNGEFEPGVDQYLREDDAIVSDIDIVDVRAERESAELQKQIELKLEEQG